MFYFSMHYSAQTFIDSLLDARARYINKDLQPHLEKGFGELVQSIHERYLTPDIITLAIPLEEMLDYSIEQLSNKGSSTCDLFAGVLYNFIIRQERWGGQTPPKLSAMLTKLQGLKLVREFKYTEQEYGEIEKSIDHDIDFTMSYSQLKVLANRYSLSDRLKKINYETPQFTMMRMALFMAENIKDSETKVKEAINFYQSYSKQKVNPPTPNFTNIGTPDAGLASCMLIMAGDTEESLATNEYLAYRGTCWSAGIGSYIQCRSVGDPVRDGYTIHQGLLPYEKAQGANVNANNQGGRGGSLNAYFGAYNPEAQKLIVMGNPRTPQDSRNIEIHATMMLNAFLMKRSAERQEVFSFTVRSHPDLMAKFFTGDQQGFEDLYLKYENDGKPKKMVSARELIRSFQENRQEISFLYWMFADEVNRHTPHKNTIHSSNLCTEILQPTREYEQTKDLFKDKDVSHVRGSLTCITKFSRRMTVIPQSQTDIKLPGETLVLVRDSKGWIPKPLIDIEQGQDFYFLGDYPKKIIKSFGYLVDSQISRPGSVSKPDSDFSRFCFTEITNKKHQPEVSMCSLSAVVLPNIKDDEEYEEACYRALKTIDRCIHENNYKAAHIGYTAKARMNAGVGIIGVATHMARLGLKYNTPEGLEEIDRLAERHAYFVIRASLRLGKELGNAPWMYKTKWPEGWLPIDTYKRTVDEIVPFKLRYDWEQLRADIIANKGIRNSSLITFPPTHTSAKVTGYSPSLYPIRRLRLVKNDAATSIQWFAPEIDTIGENYQTAYSLSILDQIKMYAVVQKWSDQAPSADFWRDRSDGKPLSTLSLVEEMHWACYYGLKTGYYMNTLTAKKVEYDVIGIDEEADVEPELLDSADTQLVCPIGGCDI